MIKMMLNKNPLLILCNSSMNAGKRTNRQGAYAKAEGMKKGVPDIHLPIPSKEFHSLYIELKRKKSGSLTQEQRFWLNTLNKAGNMAVMCRGHEEALKVLNDYISEADDLELYIKYYDINWKTIDPAYRRFER